MAAIPVTRVDLYLDGSWVDLTALGLVRHAGGLSISRGRADERGQVSPSKLSMTLDNTDGRFSARNPSSPYYGLLNRNTPVRVRVEGWPSHLQLHGSGYASTPDHASLDVTGDLDVRADIEPQSWRPYVEYAVAAKFRVSGDQRSWALRLLADGTLRLTWTTGGTQATQSSATSTAAVPAGSGRLTVRATLDVNNGAAGKTVTFWTGTGGVGGPFTQLGAAVVTAGTTSVFSGTADLTVGALGNGGFFSGGSHFHGRAHAAQVRDGIGGTVVANPDFTAQTVDTAGFTDSAGRAWSFSTEARIASDGYRFHGEVSEWPPRWNLAGTDVTVPVQAAGIMRRLGAAAEVASPLRDFVSALPGVLAYFPMEDGTAATTPGNAAANGVPAVARDVSFGPDPDLPASDGVMTLTAATSSLTAPVRATATTGFANLTVLFKLGSLPSGTVELVRLGMTGTVQAAVVSLTSTSQKITLQGVGDAGELAAVTNAYGAEVDPREWTALHVALDQTAPGTIGYNVYTHKAGGATIYAQTGSVSGTLGRPTRAVISAAADKASAKFAHLAVTEESFPFVTEGLVAAVAAYAGETAATRMERLCAAAGIRFGITRTGLGNGNDDTVVMGAQGRGNTLELLQQAADADGGVLYEPRDALGLQYRTRGSLENQGRAAGPLALDYAELAGDLAPTDDDQGVANDVTVERTNGGSARAVQETGPLNVNDPGTDPDAVGRYPVTYDLGLGDDGDLPGIAAHRLMLGTWDEARYPLVRVEARYPLVTDALIAALLRLDVGDRFTIDGPPAWLPPDTIALLAHGLREDTDRRLWTFEFNAGPAGPYDVGVWDDDDEPGVDASRWDSDSTVRPGVTPISSSQTAITFDTPTGPLWTEDPADFPFDINVGGERMRVTGIAPDTGTRQVFTVVRSVNGVVKGHPAGVAARLWKPARYGL